MDAPSDPNPSGSAGYLSITSGKGITSAQVQRDHSGEWVTCEWYSAEIQGYARRLSVVDGQDVAPWILERFGSGRYRLMLFKGGRPCGTSAPFEMVSPEHPQQAHRIGAPVAALPGPVASSSSSSSSSSPASSSSSWAPPVQPSWVQWQELQREAIERERLASAERLAAIRADEDERRARREREEDDRRRRDVEDAERRASADRLRAAAELDALRERHKLDMERARFDHELRLKALETETTRGPSAEDFADALEEAKEELRRELAKPEKPPSEFSQVMGMLQPHLPALMGAVSRYATAAAARAAAPPPAPLPPVGGE